MNDVSDTQTRPRRATGYDGRTVILFVYTVVVAIAGCMGFLLGAIGPDALRPVRLFFLIELQPTPLGLAVYGMGTIGLVLGVLLLLVRYASRHYT